MTDTIHDEANVRPLGVWVAWYDHPDHGAMIAAAFGSELDALRHCVGDLRGLQSGVMFLMFGEPFDKAIEMDGAS